MGIGSPECSFRINFEYLMYYVYILECANKALYTHWKLLKCNFEVNRAFWVFAGNQQGIPSDRNSLHGSSGKQA